MSYFPACVSLMLNSRSTEWSPHESTSPCLFLCLTLTIFCLFVLRLQFALFPCSSWLMAQSVLEKIQPLTPPCKVSRALPCLYRERMKPRKRLQSSPRDCGLCHCTRIHSHCCSVAMTICLCCMRCRPPLSRFLFCCSLQGHMVCAPRNSVP